MGRFSMELEMIEHKDIAGILKRLDDCRIWENLTCLIGINK